MLKWTAGIVFLLAAVARAEVSYDLSYRLEQNGAVDVVVALDRPVKTPVDFIVPRTYPGGYAEIAYDRYIESLEAIGADGRALKTKRDPYGPRFTLGDPGQSVKSLRYRVMVSRMERDIVAAVSTSKLRPGYAGILGYSVFGFLEGLDAEPVRLQVSAPAGWPVVLTLNPQLPAPRGAARGEARDFYALADSQVLMGDKLLLKELRGAIPLFMAIYAEGPVDVDLEANLAREALDRVQRYFGDVPISAYTVGLELLQPVDARHQYGFSQEHIASGTFTLPAEAALIKGADETKVRRAQFNFAHHMAHSWIPKRAYGEGYRPFNWEMAPVMDTIWFNEGFGRYAAIDAMARGMAPEEGRMFRDAQLASLRAIVAAAPGFIRRMSLEVLSREASFLYASDFRTGLNVFARGALMAAEMDERIREETHGEKSLRDALRALLAWSEVHQTAFATEDLPRFFKASTGIDVTDILNRWQQPLETT